MIHEGCVVLANRMGCGRESGFAEVQNFERDAFSDFEGGHRYAGHDEVGSEVQGEAGSLL